MGFVVDVCIEPSMLAEHFEHARQIEVNIVVVDVFRATTCMVTALAGGVNQLEPHAGLEGVFERQKQGWLAAGERNGQKINGFDLGNSPVEYLSTNLKGKNVAISTTNGTRAINEAKKFSDNIFIGALNNIDALTQYFAHPKKHLLILCAGWRGQPNLEDTYFAGALVSNLSAHYKKTDAAYLAKAVFKQYENQPEKLMEQASHGRRLNRMGLAHDLDYCLNGQQQNIVPTLMNQKIINKHNVSHLIEKN